MTTEQNSRPIEVLIHLTTYQGMTDDEIESIIRFKENVAYSKGNMDAVNSQAFVDIAERRKRSDETDAMLRNVLESIHREKAKLFGEVNS